MARTQLEEDIHLIAAPFRLIRNFLIAFVAILFAPVLLVWLIVASHLQPEHVGIAKFLIGVFGPLIFCLWFAGVVRWCERRNPGCPPMGGLAGRKRASSLAAYFCGIGWIGVLLSLMNNLTGIQSLWAIVLGLFSPAIFYVLGCLFGTWLTKTLAVLEIGLTVFLFVRGFGFF
jgi:hypothetical protein